MAAKRYAAKTKIWQMFSAIFSFSLSSSVTSEHFSSSLLIFNHQEVERKRSEMCFSKLFLFVFTSRKRWCFSAANQRKVAFAQRSQQTQTKFLSKSNQKKQCAALLLLQIHTFMYSNTNSTMSPETLSCSEQQTLQNTMEVLKDSGRSKEYGSLMLSRGRCGAANAGLPAGRLRSNKIQVFFFLIVNLRIHGTQRSDWPWMHHNQLSLGSDFWLVQHFS